MVDYTSNTMMGVSACHPEYLKHKCRWELTRAVVDNDAKCYLRIVDPSDTSRSSQYRNDAILTNFTALTKSGLTGLVFRKDGIVEVPQEIQYLIEDATGEDFSLDQLSQKILGEILETGRYGLLVDYPLTPSGISKESEENYLARIKPYRAEGIINWRTQTIGSKVKLTLVVLKEYLDTLGEDGFTWEQQYQYRVLRLEDGVYTQEIWNDAKESQYKAIPLNKDGNPFNYIPFVFIGSENNDAHIDVAPLYDISVLNLGHYKNSADLEESGHVCGQPSLFFGGDTSYEEFKAANPNGIKFGSRTGTWLGSNAWAQMLQVNPNQLISQMMQDKKDYAVALGARLIAPPGGRETAEAARIRFASQNSSLYIITKNISNAVEYCLQWCCEFMGGNPEEVAFELNDKFYDDTIDPTVLAQQIMLFDRNLMTQSEIRDNLRMTSIIDPDNGDEGINAQAHIQSPIGGFDGSQD